MISSAIATFAGSDCFVWPPLSDIVTWLKLSFFECTSYATSLSATVCILLVWVLQLFCATAFAKIRMVCLVELLEKQCTIDYSEASSGTSYDSATLGFFSAKAYTKAPAMCLQWYWALWARLWEDVTFLLLSWLSQSFDQWRKERRASSSTERLFKFPLAPNGRLLALLLALTSFVASVRKDAMPASLLWRLFFSLICLAVSHLSGVQLRAIWEYTLCIPCRLTRSSTKRLPVKADWCCAGAVLAAPSHSRGTIGSVARWPPARVLHYTHSNCPDCKNTPILTCRLAH